MDEYHISSIIPRLTDGPWAEPKPLSAPLPDQPLDPDSHFNAAMNLSRCLTLCAPSGMSFEDRTEWLTIATPAVLHIPDSLLDEAANHAMRHCDHPAKIIPAICAYAEANRQDWEWRNRPVVHAPRLTIVRPPPLPPAPPMTQADVDATPAYLVELGISCGALVRDDDGNLRPAA